jgi:hypothetical protein
VERLVATEKAGAVQMSGLAILRISRPTRFSNALSSMVIEVDGREVGRLSNGQDLAVQVEPGHRNVRIRLWRIVGPVLELVLSPGEAADLEIQISIWGKASLVRKHRTVSQPPGPADMATGHGGVDVVGITETHLSEETMGTETRRIDNTSSAARLTRTIRIAKEWTRTYTLDNTATTTRTQDAQIGPGWLTLRRSAEENLARMYSVANGRREEFSEEIGIEVEPGASVSIALTWKRLWQHGTITVGGQHGTVEIPFRVVMGVTFDQSVF